MYILSKSIQLGVAGIAVGLVGVAIAGALGINAYGALGPTIYSINASGLITQGDAMFKVCSDPTGLNVVTNVEWGNLSPGETKTVNLYFFNTGAQPAVFTIAEQGWVPLTASAKIDFTYTLTTTAIQPGQFRRVPISVYVDPTITVITNFSFSIVVTGTTP